MTEVCYKLRQALQSVTEAHYKVRQVLQSVTDCHYKMVRYWKVRQLLQSKTFFSILLNLMVFQSSSCLYQEF